MRRRPRCTRTDPLVPYTSLCRSKCFFQKHEAGSVGDHVLHVPIREKDGGHEDYLYVEDSDGILACVQMGTIEFHGWDSHVETLEKPDRMVFDQIGRASCRERVCQYV